VLPLLFLVEVRALLQRWSLHSVVRSGVVAARTPCLLIRVVCRCGLLVCIGGPKVCHPKTFCRVNASIQVLAFHHWHDQLQASLCIEGRGSYFKQVVSCFNLVRNKEAYSLFYCTFYEMVNWLLGPLHFLHCGHPDKRQYSWGGGAGRMRVKEKSFCSQ
jgi:hypothetical protein